MAVPGSGNPLSMLKIFSEKNENDYDANNADGESNFSLRGLSSNSHNDSSGGNINLNSDSSSNPPDQSAPHAMSEFYSYDHDFTAANPTVWSTIATIPQSWGNVTNNNSSFGSATTSCHLGWVFQPNSNRVRLRHANFTQAAALTYSFVNTTYTGDDPDSVKVTLTWSGSFSGSTGSGTTRKEPSDGTSGGSSFTWTSGNFHTINEDTANPASADTASGLYSSAVWEASVSSANQSITYDAGQFSGTAMTFQFQAVDSSGGTINSGTSTSNALRFTASKTGQGGGGGGFVCIHEDMLVDTAVGPMHIDDVVEKDPRIWSYNPLSREKELVELVNVAIVYHDNLYAINGEYLLTEDHIVYDGDKNPKSIKPELALSNYNKQSEELELGDKLSTLSGDIYLVKSIEKYEGKHKTYTISTVNDTFYAGDILVDSEI